MDYDFTRYNEFTVEKIDHEYWLIDPTPGTLEQIRGPYTTERKAWLDCPKWSRNGELVVDLLTRKFLPVERDLRIRGELRIYYDERGVIQHESAMRWRLHGAWYHGEGMDYGHAAVRSYLHYMIRKLKRTGPLADDAETSI
jgi:hypothetical protein